MTFCILRRQSATTATHLRFSFIFSGLWAANDWPNTPLIPSNTEVFKIYTPLFKTYIPPFKRYIPFQVLFRWTPQSSFRVVLFGKHPKAKQKFVPDTQTTRWWIIEWWCFCCFKAEWKQKNSTTWLATQPLPWPVKAVLDATTPVFQGSTRGREHISTVLKRGRVAGPVC